MKNPELGRVAICTDLLDGEDESDIETVNVLALFLNENVWTIERLWDGKITDLDCIPDDIN